MSLITRYRIFWASAIAVLAGFSFWKNTKSYGHKPWTWRLSKSLIDTALVVAMAVWVPALMVIYIVKWLTSPFKNRILQATASFAAVLVTGYLALTAEILVLMGIFAVDLVTGQIVARYEHQKQREEIQIG